MSTHIRYYQLSQLDSWFFRDGRPMHIGESGLAAVESMFPPPATTVAGALRAALARANGWSGKGFWSDSPSSGIAEVLGQNQDLGQISFVGPFLMQGDRPLFPMPLHVLGRSEGERWTPKAILEPGDPVFCDLGEDVRLPAIRKAGATSIDGLKSGAGYYLSAAGLGAVLNGRLPEKDDVVAPAKLWTAEPRTGIRREQTRTTGSNGLFSTIHIRLKKGVSIAMGVKGLPEAWKDPETTIPFGGESRLAAVRRINSLDIPTLPTFEPSRRMGVFLTSAAVVNTELLPGASIPGLEQTTLVAVCCEKSVRLGGWCSKAHSPIQVQSFVPAGSVLFLESHNAEQINADTALTTLGQQTEYGFGLISFGTWNN